MAGTNPLDGRPLESWQTLVNGPGGRVTVVDMRPGAALQPWIERIRIPIGAGADITSWIDNGQPSATYDGNPQTLPELVSEAPRLEFPLALVAGLVGVGGKLLDLAGGRR